MITDNLNSCYKSAQVYKFINTLNPILAKEVTEMLKKSNLLSTEDTIKLLDTYKSNKTTKQEKNKILNKLIVNNINAVLKTASGFSGYKLPSDDLYQEALIGLLKAIEKYDPEYENKASFHTFAVINMRYALTEYVANTYGVFKIATTKQQRKAFFGIRKHINVNDLEKVSDDMIEQVAKEMDLDFNVVKDMVLKLSPQTVMSYNNTSVDDEGLDNVIKIENRLYDETNMPHVKLLKEEKKQQSKKLIDEALNILTDRERDILIKRNLQDKKVILHDLAKEHGVSAERIRQIEKKAMKKIKDYMTEKGIDYYRDIM